MHMLPYFGARSTEHLCCVNWPCTPKSERRCPTGKAKRVSNAPFHTQRPFDHPVEVGSIGRVSNPLV
eukprot:361168-Chlamydomonas_euryale.AAC.5